MLRLVEPTAGEIWFEGRNVTALDRNALRSLCRDMQIIFQDPYRSLNPRRTVGDSIVEGPMNYGIDRPAAAATGTPAATSPAAALTRPAYSTPPTRPPRAMPPMYYLTCHTPAATHRGSSHRR